MKIVHRKGLSAYNILQFFLLWSINNIISKYFLIDRDPCLLYEFEKSMFRVYFYIYNIQYIDQDYREEHDEKEFKNSHYNRM